MKPEEAAERAWRIYRERVQAVLEPQQTGRFVAIDLISEDYAVGDTAGEAASEERRRNPGAVIFCLRVGSPATYRVGARWTKAN